MTERQIKVLATSEELIAEMLEKRNRGTEDCVLTSAIAKKIGLSTTDFISFLIDQKILERVNHRLQPTAKYAHLGYTMFRSQFRYTRRGYLNEVVFPVWTPLGVQFLNTLVYGNNK